MLCFVFKYMYNIFNKASMFVKVLPGRQGKQHDQFVSTFTEIKHADQARNWIWSGISQQSGEYQHHQYHMGFLQHLDQKQDPTLNRAGEQLNLIYSK